MRYTRTALGLLTRQYRSVLRKCWMINVGLFALGAAAVTSIPSEAQAAIACSSLTSSSSLVDVIYCLKNYQLALGENAQVTGGYSTAIGSGAKVTNDYGIALGYNAEAAWLATALGYQAVASGDQSIAAGYSAKATAKLASALGFGANATAESATAVGRSQATNTGSTALGNMAKATGWASVAVGNSAEATGDYSTALGNYSVANETGVVSVGLDPIPDDIIEQIWNADIDYKVLDILSGTKQKDAYRDIYRDMTGTGGHAQLTHEEIIKKYKMDGYSKIVNVADGVDDHDAVTKGQLDAAIAGAGGSYVAGDGISITTVDDDDVISLDSTYMGNNYYTQTEIDTALADYVTTNTAQDIAAKKTFSKTENEGEEDEITYLTEVDGKTIAMKTSVPGAEPEDDPTVTPTITLNGDDGSADFTGNVTVGGTLGVTGASTFTGGVTLNGGATLGSGQSLTFGDGTSVSSIGSAKVTAASNTTAVSNTALLATLADYLTSDTASNTYQTIIDSDHKLSADLVQDGTTNKVVTQTEKDTWNAKQDAITGAASSITDTDLTANMALISNGSGKVAASTTVSATELGYLDGATGNIQGQIDTITGNMFNKSNIKNSYVAGDANTVYSTGYINNEFNYGDVTPSAGTGEKNYSIVGAITDSIVNTTEVKAFVKANATAAQVGEARGEAIAKLWTENGDGTWQNSAFESLGNAVVSASWSATNYENVDVVVGETHHTLDFTLKASTAANDGIDDSTVKQSVKDVIRDSFVETEAGSGVYTNALLENAEYDGAAITQFTSDQRKAIMAALDADIESGTLALTDNYSALDKEHITTAQKDYLNTYIAGIDTNPTVDPIGAANDAVYETFLNNGSVLNTINPANSIAENLVHLDAVIGKIEGGNVIEDTATVGDNLKKLDSALGYQVSDSPYYIKSNDTHTTAQNVAILDRALGANDVYDFTEKSVADVLKEMPALDQSSLVHTTGNEKIGGEKSFEEHLRANNNFSVNQITGEKLVGANWAKKDYAEVGGFLVTIDNPDYDESDPESPKYIDVPGKLKFTLKSGTAEGETESAYKAAAYSTIEHAFSQSGETFQNEYIIDAYVSTAYTDDSSIGSFTADQKQAILTSLNSAEDLTYTQKYDDVLAPKFTVESASGNTWVAGTLQVDNQTTLSSTEGLVFNGESTVVKSIINDISDEAPADALPTANAVKSYVGTGTLKLSVNGAENATTFNANEDGEVTINLGTDFVKTADITAEDVLKHNSSTEKLLDSTDTLVNNLSSLANYSNAILAGDGVSFDKIALGDAPAITAWATSIRHGTAGDEAPTHTRLATEKAVYDYVGRGTLSVTINGNTAATTFNANESGAVNIDLGSGFVKNETITPAAEIKKKSTDTTLIAATTDVGSNLTNLANYANDIASGDVKFDKLQLLTGDAVTAWATTISDNPVNTKLATEQAVANYVGKGEYTIKVNDNTVGTIGVNAAAGTEIDLGSFVTQQQDNDAKGKVLTVNDSSGLVQATLISDSMLAPGTITADKLTTSLQTKIASIDDALKSTQIDDATIKFEANQLKVGTIDDANIANHSISTDKLGAFTDQGKLLVSDESGYIATSNVTLGDLDALSTLDEHLDAKLNKAGDTMTGDLIFSNNVGFKFGAEGTPIIGVANVIDNSAANNTLATSEAVKTYVGTSNLLLKVNGNVVEGSFSANQSGNDVTIDLGNFVTQQQDVSTAGGMALTVDSSDGKVKATQIANSMLAGGITEDKFDSGVTSALSSARSALQQSSITTGTTDGTIKVGTADVAVKGLKSAAFAETTDFAAASHGHNSGQINKMTGYSKPSTTSAITSEDSLNTAIGKLEKGLDTKQIKLTAAEGSGITIDDAGNISADSMTYSAGAGLSLTSGVFAIKDGGVTNAMLEGDIAQSKITNLTSDLASKVNLSVFNARKINGYTLDHDIVLGGSDIKMSGYQKAGEATAITTGDTVNQAIGKLEKALEGQQTLTAGDNITIANGKINAINTEYTVAAGGGLALNGTTLSASGIANSHIASNAGIETSKLALKSGDSNTVLHYDNLGNLVQTQITSAQIANNANITKDQLALTVRNALTRAENAVLASEISDGDTNGTIKVGTGSVKVGGLGTAAYTNASEYALASHNHSAQDVVDMTGYSKAANTGAILTTDTLNVAIGKLERALDDKQGNLTAGSNITIDANGRISATDTNTTYSEAADGGLELNGTAFSIKALGVTNGMLAGGITKAKLDSAVQTSLNKADSALQSDDITESTEAGKIKVGTKQVAVYGLADVATGGDLSYDKITLDDNHQFVKNTDIAKWNAKQDAISDLSQIRSRADEGHSAYTTLQNKAESWDSKLSSVVLSEGSTDGTISVRINGGTATDVAVAGLQSAAFRDVSDFAASSHTHVANEITAMTGYSIAETSGNISSGDSLNTAIGKLERGLKDKQTKLTAGANIQIDEHSNTISAIDNDTKYSALTGGGLVMSNNAFSIANGGVSNDMLAGNIAQGKLSSEVQALLAKADSALQAGDITEGTVNGKINVNGTSVAVHGLASVATGGDLGADKIITDTTHNFVTSQQISDWNNKLNTSTFNARKINDKTLSTDITLYGTDLALGEYEKLSGSVTGDDSITAAIGKLENGLDGKQATISDLTTIRNNATAGKSASDLLDSKADVWDAKVSSVEITQGSANGKIAVSINGAAATDVAVKGLKSAAFAETTDFAAATHNQASNTINEMTGYSKADAYSAIAASDSLNTAIGKLEKGLDSKQDAIDDLDTIISNANAGKSAKTLLDSKAATWDAKVGSVEITSGSTNGTIGVSINGAAATDVVITGIKSAAFAEASDFAAAGHTHVASEINKMTGYSIAATASAISANDSLNTAIGKLEKGVNDNKLTAGTGISISNGVISTTGGSAPYTAAADGGLSLVDNAFSIKDGGVTNAKIAGGIEMSKISGLVAALDNKVSTARKINGYVLNEDIDLAGGDILMTGYSKAATSTYIEATDTVNQAIGKLEKALETQQTLEAGDHIEISNGKINATYRAGSNIEIAADGTITAIGSGGAYTAAEGGGLEVASNAFSIADGGVTNAKIASGIDQSKITNLTSDLAAKVDNTRTINTHALDEDIILNGSDIKLTGYSKAAAYSAIGAGDTLNTAIGKLEKGLDTKQGTLTAGNNIHIVDGVISADGGVIYTAGSGIEIDEDHDIISIKSNSVTNAMLKGGITTDKLALKSSETPYSTLYYDAAGELTNGFLTYRQLADNAGILESQLALAVRNKLTRAQNAVVATEVTTGDTNGTIRINPTTEVAVAGLGTAAFTNSDAYAFAIHNQDSSTINEIKSYSKALSYSAIEDGDTLNDALGKLEKGLDDKQGKLTAGDNISINAAGRISATAYTAAENGGLSVDDHAFSIATGGVTNEMLEGNIVKEKLASGVRTSLGKADTALQEASITESTVKGKIKVGSKDVAIYGLESVATGGNLGADKIVQDTTHRFVSDANINTWNAKLDTSTFEARKINGFTLDQDVTLGGANIKLGGYSMATDADSIAQTDTVNQAIGKLEKSLTLKQGTLSQGDNISIENGVISAVDTKYSAANNGGLKVVDNAFSIKDGGIKNAMIGDGEIAAAKLDEDVNAALTAAGTALQEDDITEGTENGHITVGSKQVKVHGLAAVATGGKLSYDRITLDDDHQFVSEGQIEAWNAKQDAISDLAQIRSRADEGHAAKGILDDKADDWDAKLDSVTITQGSTNGTIGVSINGAAATDVAVKGLKSAAFVETSDFAAAEHTHVASEINKMTGYSIAATASAISANDSLNTAIGKLEKGISDNKLTQGNNITITDGVISAVDTKYTVAPTGGLKLTGTTLSIKESGVTNEMLEGNIALAKLDTQVQSLLGKANTALQEANISEGTVDGQIKVGNKQVAVHGLGTAAFAETTDFAEATHTHNATEVSLLNYVRPATTSAIGASDTVQTAIGKLEAGIEANKLSAGTNIRIEDGQIIATDTIYTAAANGGLSLSNSNAFSIADGGVTNAKIANATIEESKLATELQEVIDTALHESDISEGTVDGQIKVGTKQVKVHGLADVATGGMLAANLVSQSEDYRFVTDTEKALWNAKQDAISDLAQIRNRADEGHDAKTLLDSKAASWDAKVSSVAITSGSANGTIGVSINGATATDVTVTGLKSAAYAEASAFAEAGHKHVASEIEKMTGYSMPTGAVGAISANDSLNTAIGKLEKSIKDNKLTAGDNITIDENNKINATAYTAANGGGLNLVGYAFSIADGGVTNAKIASGIDQSKITNLTSDLAAKVDNTRTINGFTLNQNVTLGGANIKLTDYSIGSSTDISGNDTVNQAIGKLAYGLTQKQGTLTAGDNIHIVDGVISADGTVYAAGEGIDISTAATPTISIKSGGIKNAMIGDGEIAAAKLDGDVNAALTAAGTALQEDDITEGTENGHITVGSKQVKVHGLAAVATGGKLSYDRITLDDDHQFVSEGQIEAWNAKQDTIGDLAQIRSRADEGHAAKGILDDKADDWDAKLDSVTITQGSTNGTIGVSINGAAATDVAVKGLQAGAFKDVDVDASALTDGNLITSGAVKSYVSDLESGFIHQAGAENITGTKTFKVVQKFENIISSGADAGTYTTEIDGKKLVMNNGNNPMVSIDGKDGSANFAGALTASGGITTSTITVNGEANFNDNVTIGTTATGGSRNLTVNGALQTTGKTTFSETEGFAFGDGDPVKSIVNTISASATEDELKTQLVTAQAVKKVDTALSQRISENAADIAQQAQTIAQQGAQIEANRAAIETQNGKIDTLTSDVAANTSAIATNTAKIAAHDTAIAANTSAIATNTAKIAEHDTAISGLDTRVTHLENTEEDVKSIRAAMGGTFDDTTHKWSAKINNDKGVTYGTLKVETLVDAVSQVYSHVGEGDGLNKISQRSEVAKNNGVSSKNTINENIVALNDTVGNLKNLKIDFKNLSNGTDTAPTSVVEALNNLDATLGTIHKLNDKRGADAKGNLAKGTTVEQHLVALDDSIGNRQNMTNTGSVSYAEGSIKGKDVATAITQVASNIGTSADLGKSPANGVSANKSVNANIAAVNSAVGNVKDLQKTFFVSETSNLTDAVRVLDADMYKLSYVVDENRKEISDLRSKMRSGMASLAAMTALAPNSRAEGKTQLSIGTGAYDSRPAVAIGAFHWFTNNLMMNAGVALGDADSTVYRVGLTYSF